jgi:uracil-DNA glycosylase
MIVGQAPGARAHQTGVPWSGRSGEILRGWLEQAGFPSGAWRETWYLTSLTKCFPGKAAQGKGDRAPSPAEIALCGDHLAAELALVRPEIVVTLGKLPAPAVWRLPIWWAPRSPWTLGMARRRSCRCRTPPASLAG